MTLSEELQWRGFYNQTTFETPATLDEQQFTLYLGTDPTGDSLHVGHLAVYMMVRRFLDHGHKIVLLVGGGTGVIGDPGGRTDERSVLPLDQIADNKRALASQVSSLFSGRDFTLVDNYDWLKDVSVLDFLRDAGKHFGMSQLVQRDYIASRMGLDGGGISYAEFSYTILQGYDYWHLHKQLGVNLQIGGSDQWGNILSGVELIRKKEAATVQGMTAPLVINKSTGRKFGKSEGGAVWLNAEKTSVYKFYQFWLNTDDVAAVEYLKLFTLLSKDEIDGIQERHESELSARHAQKALAYQITSLVHGKEGADSAVRVTDVLFGKASFTELSESDVALLALEIPTAVQGISVVDALLAADVVTSKGEARRLLSGGAVSLNGEKLVDDSVLSQQCLLKKGKNTFILVR